MSFVRVGRVASFALALLLSGSGVPGVRPERASAESAPPPSVSLADFDARGPWALAALSLEGLGWFDGWTLESSLQTQARPWWAFWRDDPPFVPAYLYGDLDVIRSHMHALGYYEAELQERIVILRPPGTETVAGEDGEPGLVEVRIRVEPGPPVVVCSLYVDTESVALPQGAYDEIRHDFPVRVGEVFTRAGYDAAAERYARYLEDHGYPEAQVRRHARVDVPGHCVEVAYGLEPGRPGVFGSTTVVGLETVPEEIARREIAYEPGQKFDAERLRVTQSLLRETRLFSVVRIEKGKVDSQGEVPIEIELREGPPHEIRLGVGYGTDDGVRGLASWWNYDFLGDNRRLGFSTRISQIMRWVNASFVQPHFPRDLDTGSVSFTLGQQDESTYLDSSFVATPKIDWWISPALTATTYYAFRYDSLSDVSDQTIDDLGPVDQYQNAGFTSTAGLGLRWSAFDNAASPTRGFGIAVAAEVSGGLLGADFDHFRLLAQALHYQPLFWDLTLALSFRGGSIVPYGDTAQVPLWARLYAGGNAAFPVRGYGRRRVGPLSGSNDPLGGRTALVGTAELLYPIFGPVLGVLFLDAGDVELPAWTFSAENVQKGVGVGLRAVTPVGPVELDFGFGLDHPPGDSIFRVNFTIGPQF